MILGVWCGLKNRCTVASEIKLKLQNQNMSFSRRLFFNSPLRKQSSSSLSLFRLSRQNLSSSPSELAADLITRGESIVRFGISSPSSCSSSRSDKIRSNSNRNISNLACTEKDAQNSKSIDTNGYNSNMIFDKRKLFIMNHHNEPAIRTIFSPSLGTMTTISSRSSSLFPSAATSSLGNIYINSHYFHKSTSNSCLSSSSPPPPGPEEPSSESTSVTSSQADKDNSEGNEKEEQEAFEETYEEDQEEKGEEERIEDEYPEDGEVSPLRIIFTVLLMIVGIYALYNTFLELMPSRMAPNHLFNEAVDLVRTNSEVVNRFGDTLKAYGHDSNKRVEGRRNFIDHKEYKGMDGSKRLRIRFNVEGAYGKAACFAEVTSKQEKGEWVYLIVQDVATGAIITIHDNRGIMDAVDMAKSEEEKGAIARLLGGSGFGLNPSGPEKN